MDVTNSQVYAWQKPIWETLTSRFPKIGHALLFYGKKGCGKHAFAQHFLAWVLCQNRQENSACGECSSCQWLKSDTHPNYVYITTDEDNKKSNARIKIEKIRDLLPFVQQTVDGWRVVVIEPAEALNIASANALLKTLEEPGERVTIILLAEHPQKLPATIRSRLQHFALDRIETDVAQSYLQSKLPEVEQNKLNLLLNLSERMPLLAEQLAQAEWVDQRQAFIDDWNKVVSQKNMPLFYSNKWQKSLIFTDFVILFEYLLSDVVCVKLNQEVRNTDLELDLLAEHYHLEQLFALYEDLHAFKKMVDQNVQTNLVMDQIFIKLMNVN